MSCGEGCTDHRASKVIRHDHEAQERCLHIHGRARLIDEHIRRCVSREDVHREVPRVHQVESVHALEQRAIHRHERDAEHHLRQWVNHELHDRVGHGDLSIRQIHRVQDDERGLDRRGRNGETVGRIAGTAAGDVEQASVRVEIEVGGVADLTSKERKTQRMSTLGFSKDRAHSHALLIAL